MSLEAVINPEANVKTLVEAPVLVEKPLWEKIPNQEFVDSFPKTFWRHAPFIGMDIYSFPFISSYCDLLKDIAKKYESSYSLVSNMTEGRTETFMEKTALIRLFERNLIENLNNEKVLSAGKIKLNEIVNDCEEGSPGIDALDYTFYFKVCFPLKDVSFVIDSFLNRYQNFIDNTLKEEVWFSIDHHVDSLRKLAIIKLLSPEKFNNINILESKLYVDALNEVKKVCKNGNNDDKSFLSLSAYLKFFADEKAVLGPRGIELTMPEEKIESPTLALPDRRKF